MKTFSLMTAIFVFCCATAASSETKHLNGIARTICQHAMDAGYGTDQTGCQNPSVAWYQDRDNSMSPADDKVGRAMANVMSAYGLVQGIQVCTGVYLTTAHVTLDTKKAARQQSRKLRSPSQNGTQVIPYPMIVKNILSVSTDAQFTSPWIGGEPSNKAERKQTDYTFIKVDAPMAGREDAFIKPILTTTMQNIALTQSGKADIFLYRGKTLYNLDENGNPDYNNDTWVGNSMEKAALLRQTPMKVNQKCRMDVSTTPKQTTTECPTEAAVSGSPMIMKIDGKSFVAGMITRGVSFNIPTYQGNIGGASMLNSEAFCSDYEKVCGEPCATLQP